MSLFYLSFCDPKLPVGEQFLGACIVEAATGVEAVIEAHCREINPGGEVLFVEMSDEVRDTPELNEFFNKFVSREKVLSMSVWGI